MTHLAPASSRITFRNTAARVLAGDAYWSTIFNLSGGSKTWNLPAWYDNTVAYRRHPRQTANMLKQDGHV